MSASRDALVRPTQQPLPNLVIAPVGADGKIALYNGSAGTVQLVADIAGYYLAQDVTGGGQIHAWGYNADGELGDGTTTDSSTPVLVSGLTGVTSIAGRSANPVNGDGGGYALSSDGHVFAWGYNYDGQLGDGTTNNSTTPVQVTGLSGVQSIAAGGYDGYALTSDRHVWGWGLNARSHTPVQVSGLMNVTAIAGGFSTGYALTSDGHVWAWGYDGEGELGNGTTTDSATPVEVSLPLPDPTGPITGATGCLACELTPREEWSATRAAPPPRPTNAYRIAPTCRPERFQTAEVPVLIQATSKIPRPQDGTGQARSCRVR